MKYRHDIVFLASAAVLLTGILLVFAFSLAEAVTPLYWTSRALTIIGPAVAIVSARDVCRSRRARSI
jgi:hypothetical protein